MIGTIERRGKLENRRRRSGYLSRVVVEFFVFFYFAVVREKRLNGNGTRRQTRLTVWMARTQKTCVVDAANHGLSDLHGWLSLGNIHARIRKCADHCVRGIRLPEKYRTRGVNPRRGACVRVGSITIYYDDCGERERGRRRRVHRTDTARIFHRWR